MAEETTEMIWTTLNLNGNSRIVYAGPSQREAMRIAAALVGNNSYAHPPASDIYLYGRGDGNTEVMVRQLPKAGIDHEARFGRNGGKCYDACKAVLNSMSRNNEDGFWRAGPWADPSTEDGAGGVVEMLREATAEDE